MLSQATLHRFYFTFCFASDFTVQISDIRFWILLSGRLLVSHILQVDLAPSFHAKVLKKNLAPELKIQISDIRVRIPSSGRLLVFNALPNHPEPIYHKTMLLYILFRFKFQSSDFCYQVLDFALGETTSILYSPSWPCSEFPCNGFVKQKSSPRAQNPDFWYQGSVVCNLEGINNENHF